MFDICKIKKLIDEESEKNKALENKRMILLKANIMNVIPKPIIKKSNFLFFFNRKIIYFCPWCDSKLDKISFGFLCTEEKHYHLICNNKYCRYEFVTN